MMRKLLPAPMTSLGLIAMWLLLNESLSAGHITLAVFFGWLVPLLFAPLRPQRPRIRKPWLLVPYIARIGVDVVASTALFGRVKPGQFFTIRPDLPGAAARAAKVVQIDQVLDPASNTFRLRLEMNNHDASLPAGLRCRAEPEAPATGL